MAKRFTDTEIWDKEWFMALSCKLKCLVKMVRDKGDISGVWSPNWKIANAYVGEPVTEEDLLSIDGGNQFKKLKNGKIFCIGFIEFQYGTLSEKSPVHRKVIQILSSHKIDYKHPINRVKEEEEEKEEEKDKDKGGVGEKIAFDVFWDSYDKKVGSKSKLVKKWDSLPLAEQELILTHIPEYKLAQPDKQFRKDPSTYLNNKSWEDEIIHRLTPQSKDDAIVDAYLRQKSQIAQKHSA